MKVRAIIPCAGYGTRMGMQPHEAKEMLPDPDRPGKKIIDYALSLCQKHRLDPLILTRPEKLEFNKYVDGFNSVYVKICGDKDNFAQTVLNSEEQWYDKNILILPDTRFSPDPIFRMKFDLNRYPLVFATHKVSDPHNWGVVEYVHSFIIEKPVKIDISLMQVTAAWGLIGFTKEAGFELFTGIKQPNTIYPIPEFGSVDLSEFKDLTRP